MYSDIILQQFDLFEKSIIETFKDNFGDSDIDHLKLKIKDLREFTLNLMTMEESMNGDGELPPMDDDYSCSWTESSEECEGFEQELPSPSTSKELETKWNDYF